jgi:hypothetical protein
MRSAALAYAKFWVGFGVPHGRSGDCHPNKPPKKDFILFEPLTFETVTYPIISYHFP